VESLLAHDERAKDFIESSAMEIAADLLTRGEIQAMIGRQVGHYGLVSQFGGGGMAVVYKAEDTRLQRFVALKFLPSQIAQDLPPLTRTRSGLTRPFGDLQSY
jgi:serine/threonine protein kinase